MHRMFLLEAHASGLVLNENGYRDSGGATLFVRIEIVDAPPVEIAEYARTIGDDLYAVEFDAGQARHFSAKPDELLNRMMSVPLRIGVFRAGDNFPICRVRTHLAGCACDLASTSVDEMKPIVFRGPYDLLDPGDNPAGQISVDIRLTCMGRHVVTHFALLPDCFLFKNHDGGAEYACSHQESALKSVLHGDRGSPGVPENAASRYNFMRDIAGVCPISERLVFARPPAKPPRVTLAEQEAQQAQSKKSEGELKKRRKKR